MKSIIHLICFLWLSALDALRPLVQTTADMANVVPGTVPAHDGFVTRRLEANLTARKLLVRQGTAADQVLVGTTAKPLGSVDDTGIIGDRVAVQLLGGNRTHVLTASAAITVGADVFAAAGGKVSPLPVGAGTYQFVGVALTAAGDDGDELEVATTIPRPVVVSG